MLPSVLPKMATVEKISVSIDQSELEWARAHAKRSKQSLSAVLTDALRRQRKAAAMRKLLKTLGADRIPAQRVEAARKELAGE